MSLIYSQTLWAVEIQMCCEEGGDSTFLANANWFNPYAIPYSLDIALFSAEDLAQAAIDNHAYDQKIYGMKPIQVQAHISPLGDELFGFMPRIFLSKHYPGNPGYKDPNV